MRLLKADEVDEEMGEDLLVQLRDDDDHLVALDELVAQAEARLGRAQLHHEAALRLQTTAILTTGAEVLRQAKQMVRVAQEEVGHAERAHLDVRRIVATVRAHNQLERDELCAWLHERGLSDIRPELISRIAGAHRRMREARA